jgi:two-component system, cell cycle response regulator
MRVQTLWRTEKDALPSEMVSLSERLSLMLIVRCALVGVALSSGVFGVAMESGAHSSLLVLSGIYLVMSIAAEAVRRINGGRGLVVIGVLLLVDGIYLAWITYATGGAHSPLRFLLYGHLIAVTLLASYRTGLKIALWHSLLVFVAFYGQLAGFLTGVEVSSTTGTEVTPFHRMAVYNLMAFWFVAIGTAWFSAFRERNLRRRGFDLEALATMAANMDEVSDTSDAANCLVSVAAETFDFSRTAVLIQTDGKLKVVAAKGCDTTSPAGLMNDSAIKELKESRRARMLDDLSEHDNPALTAMFGQAKRMVLVPLVAEGNWVGALVAEVSSKRRYRVDANVLAVVERFASHASLALSNVWLLEQVQRLAETDSLTGVANRLMFDQALRAEIKRAERSGEPLALLMIDIDHFKSLNDDFGHQTGDEVLRNLAVSLNMASRVFDTVARYGGEEFAVLMPATELGDATRTGERLRKLIEELDAPRPITGSVGVASYPYNAADQDALLRAADDALYESKRAGRNLVTASLARAAEQEAAG